MNYIELYTNLYLSVAKINILLYLLYNILLYCLFINAACSNFLITDFCFYNLNATNKF